MILFKLKDCTIENIFNSFIDSHYEESSCPTCGGNWLSQKLTLTFVSAKYGRWDVVINGKDAEYLQEHFIPWVLSLYNKQLPYTLYDFIGELQENCVEFVQKLLTEDN